MILETITAGQVLAPIIASLTVVVLYHYLGREYLGAEENEYSSLNPLVAWRHYRAVGQDADAGIAKAQAHLDSVGVRY